MGTSVKLAVVNCRGWTVSCWVVWPVVVDLSGCEEHVVRESSGTKLGEVGGRYSWGVASCSFRSNRCVQFFAKGGGAHVYI